MDTPNIQSSPSTAKPIGAAPATLEELQYHFEGLRSLFVFALMGLIAMTVTIDLCFIRRQMVFAENQLKDQRPKVSEKVALYKKKTEPLVKNFTLSMQSFAASNQDFQLIFNKYRPVLWPYMQQGAAGATGALPAKAPQAPSK